jgi:hypothetical protein
MLKLLSDAGMNRMSLLFQTDETHSFGGMVESGRSHSNDGSNVDCVDIDVDGKLWFCF